MEIAYLETTFFSFYHDERPAPAIVAMRDWTLVTWNCRHLANANKFGHIRRINTMLGLKTPELVTPPELLGDIET